MLCYDCGTDGIEQQACAICVHCGAGICREHTVEHGEVVMVRQPINLMVPIAPRSRVHRCRTCDAAELERVHQEG